MKYTVVGDCDFSNFCKLVTDRINEGWVCQGGVCVIKDFVAADVEVDMYYQAMVKP